jgi:hypothetical protein
MSRKVEPTFSMEFTTPSSMSTTTARACSTLKLSSLRNVHEEHDIHVHWAVILTFRLCTGTAAVPHGTRVGGSDLVSTFLKKLQETRIRV